MRQRETVRGRYTQVRKCSYKIHSGKKKLPKLSILYVFGHICAFINHKMRKDSYQNLFDTLQSKLKIHNNFNVRGFAKSTFLFIRNNVGSNVILVHIYYSRYYLLYCHIQLTKLIQVS